MTFGIAFGIYILFLAVFWFFILMIVRHFREYDFPSEHSTKWIVRLFLATVIALNLFSLILFFNLFS